MRKIKDNINVNKYKVENSNILKLKEMVRNARNKNFFYLEHSKFATYIDPEYITIFETELVNFTKKWIRMFDQNMSAEREPGHEGHANTRGLHVMDTEQGAKDVARELLLNEDLARVGAKLHDLGHLIYAHEGEHQLSKYLQELGICELHHAILARMIIEEERIHERTVERIAQKRGRPLTPREKKEFNTYKLMIADIAASHNGEGLDYEIATNQNKTDEEMEREFINGFTVPESDKTIKSKTVEGAIVRFSDPIAYVFKDFRDGVIGQTINVNDPKYENIFIEMGFPKAMLDDWATKPEKKDKIVRYGTYLLRDDLVENSRGINGARMSKRMADLMYKLRNLNYDEVVKPRTRKIMNVFGERTEQLIDIYSNVLLEYEDTNSTNEPIELKPFTKKMLKRITMKQPQAVRDLNIKIVQKGIKGFVTREVEDILNGTNKCVTKRRRRLETDLRKLCVNGTISNEEKELYIKRVINEIGLSPNESKKLLRKRVKIEHPEATEEELDRLVEENKDLRFETYRESLAKFRASMYIGQSGNDYLLDMLQEEGLLSQDERNGRWVSGGDVSRSSINQTQKNQMDLAKREGR